MRLAAYNILDGGAGRLDPIHETLKFLHADAVGLCEADDNAALRYLGDKLGMEYVRAVGDSGHAVALLSRSPIRSMINLSVVAPALDRGAMEARIGANLRIVVAHLHAGQSPEDEVRRVAQVRTLFDLVERDRSTPTVVLGDFNAASPDHPFDFDAASPRVQRRLAEHGVRSPGHDAVRAIQSRGWIDAIHKARPDSKMHTYTTGFPTTRYDYIWLYPDLCERLEDAGVEQRGFAPYCSDHYPVWAAIRS